MRPVPRLVRGEDAHAARVEVAKPGQRHGERAQHGKVEREDTQHAAAVEARVVARRAARVEQGTRDEKAGQREEHFETHPPVPRRDQRHEAVRGVGLHGHELRQDREDDRDPAEAVEEGGRARPGAVA